MLFMRAMLILKDGENLKIQKVKNTKQKKTVIAKNIIQSGLEGKKHTHLPRKNIFPTLYPPIKIASKYRWGKSRFTVFIWKIIQ